jgi:hypothetical protein
MHSVGRLVATRGRLAGGASAATSAVRPVRPGGGGSGAADSCGIGGALCGADASVDGSCGKLVENCGTSGTLWCDGSGATLSDGVADAADCADSGTFPKVRSALTDGPSDDGEGFIDSIFSVDLAGDRRAHEHQFSSETCWA